MKGRIFGRKGVGSRTPLQIVIGRFDGEDYLKLDDEDVELADTLCRLWYIRIDDRGHISATERGRGIMDGSIRTSHDTPAFLTDYMSRYGGYIECGTAGPRP